MHKELLATSPFLALPVAALLLFLGVFVAIFVRTMARKPSGFDAVAQLPLEDSNER